MDYKKEELKEYFDDFIDDSLEYLKEDEYWKDDLHHNAFNQDYYITGTYKAKKWLGDMAFDVIEHIREYEQLHFGEVNTDLSDAEKIVNMYVYIIGEEIVHEWLENYEKEEEEDKPSISPFSKTFLKDTFSSTNN
jgi:hypothetical protein